MIRTIGAALVGYIIMVIGAIFGYMVAWAILGAEGAFQADSTVASGPWTWISFIFGFAAAVAGGWTACRIGNDPSNLPIKLLAGFVFLLGLVLAVYQLGQTPPPLPEGLVVSELVFTEAGQYAVSPTWVNFFLPILGAVGVLLGGSLGKKK